MAGPWPFLLLGGLLAATLVRATFSPAVVLSLGPEVIKEKLSQELRDAGATTILQQLPLLSAIRDAPTGGIPILGSLVNTVLRHIVWLKVTSANILQLQVQPSAHNQELEVKIPLDMVAGLNTPLVKTIVELHMETEVQATISMDTGARGAAHLSLRACSTSHGGLRISLLHSVSFLVNSLADKVMSLLAPALPKLVKSQAKLVDSQGKVTKWFNNSSAFLTKPPLDSAPFSLTVRQDVVNAAVAAMLPPEEFTVLLDYVLPELARLLKLSLKGIQEKAADELAPSQLVKIATQETPELLLSQGRAKVAQLVVLEIFPTDKASRPLFTLGIEASSESQFYTQGDRLMLNLNGISSDRIQLMNSRIGWFEPEALKPIITEILVSVLLPNENGKLRSGIPMSIVKALGFETAAWSLTRDALVVTAASS
ncbi:BPI fold-containing family B member 1 [Carlito syrichta]|uniref:BPI fold-containing family B member 1 n=1 Tax=Carlito syrichta TaxID=1868482 RepID=A0A1U7TDN7_CARSF|nr:BPI fold-containing family B member 1 [Carlito syrichta]